jgi:competence protein ComFC
MSVFTTIWETARDLVFPAHCYECGDRLPAGWLCQACSDQLIRIEPPICRICSKPFAASSDKDFVCMDCRSMAFHFQCVVVPLRYGGTIRDMIHGLKYHSQSWLAKPLGAFLEEALVDERLPEPIDAFVPVPLHPVRLRERGYNQALLLAQELSSRANIPVLQALHRCRPSASQTEFNRRQRMQNLRDAFALRQNVPVKQKKIVLVDDVLTTGVTLNECARVLLQAGASSVHALAVARG